MTILVDTSVWSLALRRDVDAREPEVEALKDALLGNEVIVTTGIVLQELLQGFSGPRAQTRIIERFAALPFIQPDRDDHVAAAAVRNTCRRSGVQLGTIDALIARLCIRHELTLLTADKNFVHAARHCALAVWPARRGRERRDA